MKYNTSSYLAGITLAASLGFTAAEASVSVAFDTFTTYTGGNPGIALNQTGIGSQTDSPEFVPLTDTFFSGLSRRATLNVTTGAGESTLNNNNISLPGKLSWGNPGGNLSTGLIRYDFAAMNLTSLGYNQLAVDFFSADLAGTMTVSFRDSFNVDYSLVVPITPATTTVAIPKASFGSGWDDVKRISFTLSSPNLGGADYIIDGIRMVNDQVPEAKTVVPTLGFAAAVGLLAWRRRSTK